MNLARFKIGRPARALARARGLAVLALLWAAPAALWAAPPVVFFTDVDAGPVTGGPNNLGVPISIFGKGFGAARGSSTVFIGGQEVAAYLVWGEYNAHNPTLDMIVVQPGPAVTGGAIVVTVAGQASNTDCAFAALGGKHVYFISPAGTDNPSCSAAAPCATLQHVGSDVMQPGDAALIRGGSYAEGDIWIRGDHGQSGLPGQNKAIRNYPGEDVFLTNGSRNFTVDADYITVAGLNLQNGKALSLAGWSSINQQGCRLVNNTFRGLISYDAIDSHGGNVLVAGNDCNVTGSTMGTEGHCYYISVGSHLRLLHNIGAGAPGYQIHLYDEVRANPDFQRIISDVLIEGNVLRSSPERAGLLINMSDCGAYYGGICYGNTIDAVMVRNNVFTANNFDGIFVEADQGTVRNIKIYNNTFYQNGTQGIYVDNSAGIHNVDIRNNLIDQSANANCQNNCGWFTTAHIQVGAAAQNVTLANNFYSPAPATLLNCTDASPMTGAEDFFNPPALDFHLHATSGAIDHGLDLSADVPRDFDGLQRPQGGTFDLGAFEYNSGYVPPPTPTPTTQPTPGPRTPVPGAPLAAQVYPNPWRADRNANSAVTFNALPAGSAVKIFGVSGALIVTLRAENGSAAWKVNDSSKPAAAGVYLYLIETPGGQKIRGKLAVTR